MRFSSGHFRGWCAAGHGDPFDEFESDPWKEGWQLWHSRDECVREWIGRPDSSVAVH